MQDKHSIRQPLRRPDQTRSIRGTDLNDALEKVRRIYGDNALIVQTRKVQVAGSGGSSARSQVEILVAEEVQGAAAAAPVMKQDPMAWKEALKGQMSRIHELGDEVSQISALLQRRRGPTADYPLQGALRVAGVDEDVIRQLAAHFLAASRGGMQNATAARRHLAGILRCLPQRQSQSPAGEHWIMGRAGAGKTTFAMMWAAQLIRAGIQPVLVGLKPRSRVEIEHWKRGASALGIGAAVAQDMQEYNRIREHFSGRDVLLVDTPCCLSRMKDFPVPDGVQRHLLLSLSDSRSTVEDILRGMHPAQGDSISISQMDLSSRRGRVLEYALRIGRPIAFLMGEESDRMELQIARHPALLDRIIGGNVVPLKQEGTA